MLIVARKNLFSERTRLAISVGGVALSVFLISLLLSLYRGWNEKVGGFVEEAGIDVWIAREGTTDFISAASILPLEGGQRLGELPTVARWSPLIVRPMSATRDGKDFDVHLIGYDTDSGMGGPIRIDEGESVPGPSETIVDEEIARRYGVGIGETINAAGHDLNVVGISSGGNFVFSQTVFVSLEQATTILEQEGFVTFFLIELKNPKERARWAASVQRDQPGILAITGDDFAAATRERILGEVVPILTVILLLAFVVGLAVAGLTIYTATVEKSREYGILKAVGFANTYLYRTVFEQSIVTGFLGFLVGVALTLLVGPFAQDVVAQFVLYTRWQDVLAVAGVTLLMALIAAYIPVRRLAAIDPVAVFKA